MKLSRYVLIAALIAGTANAAQPPNDSLRSIDDLMKAAAKAVKTTQSDKSNTGNVDQYLAVIRSAITREDYAEAERGLNNLRNVPFITQSNLFPLLDQAINSVHLQVLAKDSATERAIESLSADVYTKITAHAPAKDFDFVFEKLNGLSLSRANYGNNDNSAAAKAEALRSFISRWQDYLVQSAQGNADLASNALGELISLTARIPVVPRSELLALQGDVAKLRESRLSASTARLAELTKRVQTLIDGAKTAAELDDMLGELVKTRFADDNRGYGPNGLEQLRQFTTKWQDYLAKLESGNTNGALEVIKSLVNDSSVTSIYPRSKLLARLNSPSTGNNSQVAAQKLPEHLTVENLDQFLKALRMSNDDYELNDLKLKVTELANVRRQLQAGNFNAAWSSLAYPSSPAASSTFANEAANIKRLLLLEAAVGILKPAQALAPTENEAVTAYLQRQLDRARDTSDWQGGYSILSLMMNVDVRSETVSRDLFAYRQLTSAANFETAGQYSLAVQCYLAGLRAAGPNTPVALIGKKLKAIEEAHPSEFANGKQLPEPSVFPSAPMDPRFRNGPPQLMNRP